jgi:hypothetical protein
MVHITFECVELSFGVLIFLVGGNLSVLYLEFRGLIFKLLVKEGLVHFIHAPYFIT